MTSYNIYPTIPSASEGPQVYYHLNMIQSKQQGLLKLEERYKKKYTKYTKILNRLTWLSACSSSLSEATGISSVTTPSTFIGLPVSIPLGVISLTGVSVNSMATALTKKYQKKLSKVTKLTDILTSAIAVFETCLSEAFCNGKIDEEEFNMLQTFHLKTMNELMGVSQSGGREQEPIRKNLLEEMNEIKKTLGTRV